MDEREIFEHLTSICQDIFDDESIRLTPELSARDVDGWDSLSHIRLILTVEKTFKFEFSTTEIGTLQTIGDLLTLINAKTPK